MKRSKTANTHAKTATQPSPKAKLIKLGIDVHKASYRVVRQIDNAHPQRAQKFTPEEFLVWAGKQLSLAEEVHSCYEAGCFGYVLHRQLAALGIKNLVIQPQNWDERHKGVKTDQLDALAMVQRLDRYLAGNKHALGIVRVPSEVEQLKRSESRLRDQLLETRRRVEAQGRSLMLFNGLSATGRWWKETPWKSLQAQLPPKLLVQIERYRQVILAADLQLEALTAEIEAAAPAPIRGLGALTNQILDREICDWHRFGNRRQVASMTGMCPQVRASGEKSVSGPISKSGNRRVRTALVELAWRCLRFQPNYPPLRKYRRLLAHPKTPAGQKNKAITAIGRHLVIDLWRIKTQRATAEELGLE